MTDAREIIECASCQLLIKKYSRNKLQECDFCGHLFHGKHCDCGENNPESPEECQDEKVQFT